MNKNTRIIIAGVVVVVLLVGLYAILRNRKSTNTAQPDVTQQQSNADAQNVAEADATVATPTAPTGSAASQTDLQRYNEARNKYANRIQFTNCHGSVGRTGVGTLVMDFGTQFMIDNNDPKAHTYVVKSQTFKVKPNYFAIVTAKDLGTYPVSCDGQTGATLTVQK